MSSRFLLAWEVSLLQGGWMVLTQAPAAQHLPMGFLCESLPRGKSTGKYRQDCSLASMNGDLIYF